LTDHPIFHAFPCKFIAEWHCVDFVPDHSGGPTPDLHGIPYQANMAPELIISKIFCMYDRKMQALFCDNFDFLCCAIQAFLFWDQFVPIDQ